MFPLPMEALSNVWYGSWRPLTRLGAGGGHHYIWHTTVRHDNLSCNCLYCKTAYIVKYGLEKNLPGLTPYPSSAVVPAGLLGLTPSPSSAVVPTGLPPLVLTPLILLVVPLGRPRSFFRLHPHTTLLRSMYISTAVWTQPKTPSTHSVHLAQYLVGLYLSFDRLINVVEASKRCNISNSFATFQQRWSTRASSLVPRPIQVRSRYKANYNRGSILKNEAK